MAARVAALRLLLRRRAGAPPAPALLRPLSPASAALRSQDTAAVDSLQDMRHVQLKQGQKKACVRTTWLGDEQGCYTIAYSEIDIMDGLVRDYKEWSDMITEALATYDKGLQLFHEGLHLHGKAIALLEKGLDDLLKAVVLSENWLEHFVKTTGNSKKLPENKLLENQMFCKMVEDFHKKARQHVEELSTDVKTLKTVDKLNKGTITVGVGLCFLLLLRIIGIC
ncbi:hypothetical protein ACP70R_032970 [Stipagrostis hirtigluma subsp. patula]